jgi:hypothetical protein
MIKQRNKSGSALVMSVALLVLIGSFTTLFTMLIANAGIASIYANKVNFVADQAAQFAAGELSWDGSRTNASIASVTQDVNTLVNSLLASSGLPAASQLRVQDNGNSVNVTFKVSGLALVSQSNLVFPGFIDLNANGVKDLFEDEPHGLMGVSIQGVNVPVLLPVYGRYPFSTTAIDPNLPGAAGLRNYERPIEQQEYSGMPGGFSQTLL